MFEQKLNNFDELPVRENDRKCTDVVCTCIGGVFALTLLIISLIMLNKENYFKTNFPTDSDNKPCAYDQNQNYPFIYFPNINDKQLRVCVSSCPQSSDLQIQCRPNSKVSNCASVNIYQSAQTFQRLGGFCMPEDQAARDKLVDNANLGQKWRFLNTYDVIRLSLLLALAVGILWLISVKYCPKVMATGAIGLGSAILLVSGILVLIDNPIGWQGKQIWKIIIGVILIMFSLAFIAMLCLYRRRLRVSSIFIDYAGRFLGQKPINFIFIPIFILLTVGLIFLCLFQYLAISSSGETFTIQDDIYLHTRGSPFLAALVIFQFIWGNQFLKDTFNFFISGNATQWYVNEGRQSNCFTPVSRFFKYNFGSVCGGSFLNAFFNFIDFLYQTLRCYPEGCCGMCAPCSNAMSKCCGCFFDLVRNDAYAYINLTGIPYCNAARNCQVLCNSSKLFVGSQSVLFFYRLLAHCLCVGLVTLICYAIMKNKISGINLQSLLLIIFFSYCLVTFFIDIHADAAEGLQICYLLDNDLNGPRHRVPELQDLNNQLQSLTKGDEDGKCSAD